MPDWFHDPVVRPVMLGAAALIGLVIVIRTFSAWRERRWVARQRKALRDTYGDLHARRQAIEQLVKRIIATSSTSRIVGFSVVRQIEAVFVDGQPTPERAVEELKARAAEIGANALINLASQRLPSGKCVASGDAVIVRPLSIPRGPVSGGPGPAGPG